MTTDSFATFDLTSESGDVALKRYTHDPGQGFEVFTGKGMIICYLRTVDMKNKENNAQLSNAIAFPVDFDEVPPRVSKLDVR